MSMLLQGILRNSLGHQKKKGIKVEEGLVRKRKGWKGMVRG